VTVMCGRRRERLPAVRETSPTPPVPSVRSYLCPYSRHKYERTPGPGAFVACTPYGLQATNAPTGRRQIPPEGARLLGDRASPVTDAPSLCRFPAERLTSRASRGGHSLPGSPRDARDAWSPLGQPPNRTVPIDQPRNRAVPDRPARSLPLR